MCQMKTSFWSCGQLAEGKTILCLSYQLTQGKCCDGYSSFSRMIHEACADCLAGKAHPQIRDLNASIAIKACAVQDFVPNHVPISEANALTGLSDMCTPADRLNVADPTVTAPPSKSSTSRVKKQHQAAPARALPPKSVRTAARLSTKGGIQKLASAGNRSSKSLLPIAETVARISSSPKRSPKTKVSQSLKTTQPGGTSDPLHLSVSSIQDLEFPFDPALIGLG